MTQAHDCAPVWRWARTFSADELARKLDALGKCPTTGPESDAAAALDPSWNHYYSEAVIARERPGRPESGGAFSQARHFITSYSFSDPDIARAHFDSQLELRGRPMLLELNVLGFHFLCGVVVRATRDESGKARSVFGYRYDTLEGHVEAGAEWFLLSKDHESGEVRFRIQAAWREGHLPSWWMRIGFRALARPYQRHWHRLAYVRLRAFLNASGLPPIPGSRAILQRWRPSGTYWASDEETEILEHESAAAD